VSNLLIVDIDDSSSKTDGPDGGPERTSTAIAISTARRSRERPAAVSEAAVAGSRSVLSLRDLPFLAREAMCLTANESCRLSLLLL